MDLGLWSSDRLPTRWQPPGDGLKIAAEVIPKIGMEWAELAAKSTLPLVITTTWIATGASTALGISAAALLTIFFEHIKGQSSTDKHIAAMVKEPLVNGCDKIRLALTVECKKPKELARRDQSLREAAEALLKAKAHFKDARPDLAESIEYLRLVTLALLPERGAELREELKLQRRNAADIARAADQLEKTPRRVEHIMQIKVAQTAFLNFASWAAQYLVPMRSSWDQYSVPMTKVSLEESLKKHPNSGDGLKMPAEAIPKLGKELTELAAKASLPLFQQPTSASSLVARGRLPEFQRMNPDDWQPSTAQFELRAPNSALTSTYAKYLGAGLLNAGLLALSSVTQVPLFLLPVVFPQLVGVSTDSWTGIETSCRTKAMDLRDRAERISIFCDFLEGISQGDREASFMLLKQGLKPA